MYRVLVLFALFGALRAEEPCTCDQVTNDIEDLRRFLVYPENIKVGLYNVIPGELSPYICNCNKYRQRRSEKVHPKLLVQMQTETSTTQTPETRPMRTPKPFFSSSASPAKFLSSQRVKCAKKKPQLGPYRCATGLMRRGFKCIPDPCYGNQ